MSLVLCCSLSLLRSVADNTAQARKKRFSFGYSGTLPERPSWSETTPLFWDYLLNHSLLKGGGGGGGRTLFGVGKWISHSPIGPQPLLVSPVPSHFPISHQSHLPTPDKGCRSFLLFRDPAAASFFFPCFLCKQIPNQGPCALPRPFLLEF